VDPAAEAAIRTGNNVLAAGNRSVVQDSVSDELLVFDKVDGMADDTWHQHLACRQLCLLPHAPLMLGAGRCRPRRNRLAPSPRGSDR